MLELHVWGPAFSLPSIDPQCLATIAYLVKAVPVEEWVLVASSDPSVSPTNELPALKNGGVWVSKFRNIVDYVRQYSDQTWDLDSEWTGLDKADVTAFSAFVESNGQLLIDLSLYVSSQNYYASTSPAYGSILTWPNQWILPPKLRHAAKHRTEHLGLSSLDLEASEEHQRERERSSAAGQIPQNLISRPRETVSTLLGKTARSSHFRLDALTAELFEPLEALLGKKAYFLADGHRPSSLDALVLGYLSLMLFPEVPAVWLRESLRTKTPRLAQYVERLRDECFGGVVQLEDAFLGITKQQQQQQPPLLPWQKPERVNAAKIGNTLLNTLADATPILKEFRMNSRLQQAAKSIEIDELESSSKYSKSEARAISEYAIAQRRDIYISIASVAAGVAAMVGYLFYNGVISISFREKEAEEEAYDADEVIDGGSSAEDILGIPTS